MMDLNNSVVNKTKNKYLEYRYLYIYIYVYCIRYCFEKKNEPILSHTPHQLVVSSSA